MINFKFYFSNFFNKFTHRIKFSFLCINIRNIQKNLKHHEQKANNGNDHSKESFLFRRVIDGLLTIFRIELIKIHIYGTFALYLLCFSKVIEFLSFIYNS